MAAITARISTIDDNQTVARFDLMLRLNQLMMGFSVGIACLLIAPSIWHQFQLWRNHGVSCQHATIDGEETRYGQACSP